MLKMLYILYFSCLISQGIYADKKDPIIYSLNIKYNSEDNSILNTSEDYWNVGLSSVLKGINEYGLNYQKKKEYKSFETFYNYYIKPDFYLKMSYGISYMFIDKYDDGSNINRYGTRLSFYGDNKNSKGDLKFYPILSYEYFSDQDDSYDILTLGLSVLFNDIGFEPSLSYISEDIKEFSVKLYLWEFSTY